jgi:hypothetical protein
MSISATFILAVLFTLFLCLLMAVYWKSYGAQNFLWLSDIGLFLTVFALWLHSSLLISMAVIGIMPLEIIWGIDYVYQLLTKKPLIGIANYMFEKKYSRFLRGLSLFHVIMPFIWLSYLCHWGYAGEAPLYQTLLTWIVMLLTYFFTNPKDNINWVFFPSAHQWKGMPSYLWLMVILLLYPLIVIWPMHYLIKHF